LKLMVENRFPKIWVPTVVERDLRQLLIHRQHLVRMRGSHHITRYPGLTAWANSCRACGADLR
jgi:hypothetical protein